MASDPSGPLMERYARALTVAGPLLALAAAALDPRWLDHLLVLAALFATVLVLRAAPVRLSKFSYLTQTGVPALVAAVATPPSVGVLALAFGVFASDVGWLRKPLRAGAVNAGREALAFAVAYGFYALAVRISGVRGLSLDFLPPAVILAGMYFVVTRTLFYLSLILRAKLEAEERVFILRWEMVSFLMTLLATGIMIWTLTQLNPAGWAVVIRSSRRRFRRRT